MIRPEIRGPADRARVEDDRGRSLPASLDLRALEGAPWFAGKGLPDWTYAPRAALRRLATRISTPMGGGR